MLPNQSNKMESKRRRGRSFIDEDDDQNEDNQNQNHHDSNYLEPYDPSIPFEDDSNNEKEGKEEQTEEENDEEEYFTRTRTRSRSVHENDDKVKILSEKEIQAQVAKSKEHSHERTKIEKTGPLQSREVAALQQGLQEATNKKREEERLEEQAELEAALREKEQRTMSSSAGHSTTIGVQIGTDPPMRRVKILLLGDSNVGKTSIISRLTTGDFKTRMVQTVGVDYKVKKVNLDGENIQVQLWDTAGSERFHQITTSYYRGVNGIMLCFDVSVRESYERVAYWLQNIKKYASENVHVMLVGNKIDLRTERNDPNAVYEREVKPIANKYGISYAETSALTSDNVEGALLSLVRDIVQGDSDSLSAAGIRKSMDSFMKKATSASANSKSNNGTFGSGSGSGSGEKEKDKEKCIVC